MTCIIGYKDKNKIYFGADSRTSCGHMGFTQTTKKVFIKDNIIYGVSGHVRVKNIILYNFYAPERRMGSTIDEYMNVEFLHCLRQCLIDNGFAEIQNNVEQFKETSILIGIAGHIYEISSNYSITEYIDDYQCIGSGEELSRGALHALEKIDMSIEDKITIALEAAARYDEGVAAPFYIESISF